jgi:hypothetical protein
MNVFNSFEARCDGLSYLCDKLPTLPVMPNIIQLFIFSVKLLDIKPLNRMEQVKLIIKLSSRFTGL